MVCSFPCVILREDHGGLRGFTGESGGSRVRGRGLQVTSSISVLLCGDSYERPWAVVGAVDSKCKASFQEAYHKENRMQHRPFNVW